MSKKETWTKDIIKIVELLKPRFYNRLTWLIVISGTALLSKPIWLEMLNAIMKKEYAITIIGEWDALYGLLTILIGLAYNVRMHKLANVHIPLTEKMDEFDAKVMALGIDLVKYSQLKEKINNGVHVYSFYHEVIISGSDLLQKFCVEGFNNSTEDITNTSFSAEAVHPSTVAQMQIKGVDLENDKELLLECSDKDQSNVKKLIVYFSDTLEPGKSFKIQLQYKLSDTMEIKGDDFFTSGAAYEFGIDSYELKLTFEDNCPEKLKLYNVSHKMEKIISPENGSFHYAVNPLSKKSLEHIRVICVYNRK